MKPGLLLVGLLSSAALRLESTSASWGTEATTRKGSGCPSTEQEDEAQETSALRGPGVEMP